MARRIQKLALAAGIALLPLAAFPVSAAPIIAGDMTVVPLAFGQVKSAVGGLDLILMTGQNGVGVLDNEFGLTDIDDANSDLPNNSSGVNESYATTFRELRAFYNLSFAAGAINRIVIFTDMQQAGGTSIQIDLLEIVLNPTGLAFSPVGNDATTAEQNAVAGSYGAGTVLASTDPDVVAPVTLNAGSGWADWAIVTPIDPFDAAYDDDDVILFHFQGQSFTASSETFFLSGSSTLGQVPEPTILGLLGMGLLGVAAAGRRR